MSAELKTAATLAANAGMRVFFIRQSKIPFAKEIMDGRGWLEYATDDPLEVSAMYDDHAARGRAMSLAVWAGASGLVIVDCDTPEAEVAWLDVVGAAGARTLQTKTPREGGGRHFIYSAPSGVYLGNGRPNVNGITGLDIRAGNSYAVLPPSTHAKTGGTYRFMFDGELLDWREVFANWNDLIAPMGAAR